MAAARAELVSNSIKDIKMTYKVGTESTCCSKTAAELAKKSGGNTTYVVGDAECGCNYEARLNLAKAKYAAAVKAIASADAKAATATKSDS